MKTRYKVISPNELFSFVLYCLLTTDIYKVSDIQTEFPHPKDLVMLSFCMYTQLLCNRNLRFNFRNSFLPNLWKKHTASLKNGVPACVLSGRNLRPFVEETARLKEWLSWKMCLLEQKAVREPSINSRVSRTMRFCSHTAVYQRFVNDRF